MVCVYGGGGGLRSPHLPDTYTAIPLQLSANDGRNREEQKSKNEQQMNENLKDWKTQKTNLKK